ncbi:copper transporter family protein, partial [archaeon]
DYKLKLLFESWDIQEKWQFALSWFTVVLAVVVYHALRYCIGEVELWMSDWRRRSYGTPSSSAYGTSLLKKEETVLFTSDPKSRTKLRLLHAFLSALQYGVRICLLFCASCICYIPVPID